MWLIADSGSSKTEWILFDAFGFFDSKITIGLNPLFLPFASFKNELVNSLPGFWLTKVTKLWFYSAGCNSEEIKNQTKDWLKQIIVNAKVEVESDLMAAARSTCGINSGIVAILGTGSNSAYYDGIKITEHIRPLGYILGDEGSGVALGKALLKKLLRNQLPLPLSEAIYKELGLSYNDFIQKVYRSEWPNKFIASCARILFSHKSEPMINELINNEFNSFAMLLKSYAQSENSKVNFVGSIAHHFESNLTHVMANNNLILGSIIQSPAKALQAYHLKNE